MWIRIANDPLDRPLVDAMSLGEFGVAFKGFAIEVPDDFFSKEDFARVERYFDVVDEADITDLDKKAMNHNQARNQAFQEEAQANQQQRIAARAKAAKKKAARSRTAAPSDAHPDSDDD